MSVRYTVTDSAGCVHTRTSTGHLEPHYTFAVVRQPGVANKSLISYHGTRELAARELQVALKPMVSNNFTRKTWPDRVGKPIHPNAAMYPVTAEVHTPKNRKAA